MIIEKEILDKITKSHDETITKDINVTYKYLSEHVPCYIVKTINKRRSSYSIKHQLQRILDVYVSNLDIKYCMELLGGKSWHDGINYYYAISQKWYNKIDEL